MLFLFPPIIPALPQVGSTRKYLHVEQNSSGQDVVGTLSMDKWEDLTVYSVFAFRKMK